jgi:hypothetical protein
MLSNLDKDIEKLSTNPFPGTYIFMGASPRIVPYNYGKTVNSCSRITRNHFFFELSNIVRDSNYILIDVDLKACFTSLVLGLFSNKYPYTRDSLNKGSLWEYIRKEFIEHGIIESYDKDSCKVCVYASYFGGSTSAFIQGILDNHQKNLGLSPQEFREFTDFPLIHKAAIELAVFMSSTSLISEFKESSLELFLDFKGLTLVGPTGHYYKVDNSKSWGSTFSNFLQSYEFYLLSKSLIRTFRKFPDSKLLYHFHDGNVMIVKKSNLDDFTKELRYNLDLYAKRLNLSYKQEFEIKCFNEDGTTISI